MVSPMQRFIPHSKPKDDNGNELEGEEEIDLASLNPHLQPCGGFKPGKVHFDAEVSSKLFVAWKTLHPDISGNCTISLGSGVNQENF